MKKIFLIFPVLAVMLLFACQKTPDVHITEHEKAKTVTVEAPAGFVWGEDDRIVVNGMKSSLTELDMEDDTRVTFSFNVGLEVPHCAVYPVSMFDSWSKEDKTAKVVIPTVQTSDGNTINPETKLMLGYGDELGKVEISDAMAYIRLTPTKGETAFNISSVKVSDPEGYAVSGKFTARFSEEGRTLENTKQDGSIIDVTCGATGAALGSDIFFAVPAKTYSKGLQFEIYDMDGSFQDMIFPSEGEFVAEAGKTYTKAFVYEPKSILDLGEIPNVEIWNRFAAKIRGGEDFTGRSFKLTANISSDNLEMADGVFNGMLDGNGKTISRSAATRPLFRELGAEAEVTNLTLTGEFSAFEKPYEYGNAALAQINLGNVTNVSANCSVNLRLDGVPSLLGGIVAQNGGVMKRCTNDGNVTLEVAVGDKNGKDVACANFGGGLAAYGHTIAGLDPNTGLYFADAECKAGKFVDCVNNGSISVKATSGSKALGVSTYGGICGVVELDGVVFENCRNTGAISRISDGEGSSGGSTCVGGILGRCAGTFANDWKDNGAQICINGGKSYSMTVTGCENSGALLSKCRHSGCLNNGNSPARLDNVGGIIGAAIGKDDGKVTLSECTSTGAVTGGWATSVNTTVLGGIIGLAQNVKMADCVSNGTVSALENTCVGAAGGFTGFSFKGVSVSGESSCGATFKLAKLNKDLAMLWGLAFGNVTENAAIDGASFSCSTNIDGAELELTADNFMDYLCNTASKVQPTVRNCTWSK